MPGPCSAGGAGKPVIAPGPTVAGPAPDVATGLVLEYASKVTAIDPTATRPVCAGLRSLPESISLIAAAVCFIVVQSAPLYLFDEVRDALGAFNLLHGAVGRGPRLLGPSSAGPLPRSA